MAEAKTKKPTRPNRISMEGMIWNANHVLEAALDPDNHGVPAELFRNCEGVVLLSVVQAGLIFTGHYGTGVMMAKQASDDGTSCEWSAPVAVGAGGYGGGAFLGAEVDDILIFILDKEELGDFATRPQTRINMTGEVSPGSICDCSPFLCIVEKFQLLTIIFFLRTITHTNQLTIGKHGREANLGLEAPHHKTVTVVFSKGLFGGIGIEMGTLQILKKVNSKFYDIPHVKTTDILFKNSVNVPTEKGVEELHKKLSWLAAGQTWRPGAEDVDKSEKLRQKAEAAGKQVHAEHKEDIHVIAPQPSS
jgi:lipid-binding SYLF domain-containing protein